LEETETERQSLADERDRLAAERDEIESERDELAEAVDRLESEVEDLREERDRLRDELSNARERLPDAERTLTPGEAREGTNLFIRYDSKEGATLADAHEGAADREALRENLRVEHHTSFETDGLAVDGRPFEEFLQDTIEYGFTRWLVEDLPFEVRGTGNEGTLRDLYDALPEIDRAEIGGTVSIAIREGGEETREQRAFDLVLRDRMGHPLFVADLNDSRDPTAEGTLESLVENGRDIAASNETFAGAFAVTESFFEPGALETASDAVGGGLFSRSKRASFVKLSRKQGYHLCLVEARDGGFHMTVPDL
jgi:outer membrane murein-binding lipoprotein Lpp